MLVTIGTPHSGHYAPQYVISLAQTLLTAAPYSFEVMGLESCYVHSGRNIIFNNARGDYLLFIDSDMAWKPDDIQRLLRADRDIVGGLYYKRRHPYGPVVYAHNGKTFDPIRQVKDRLFQCDGIGTGFLLISRKVIDLFKTGELLTDWGYAFDPLPADGPGDANSYYMGEDLSFCMKAKHVGLEIWCDPETVVKHIGEQEVGGPL